MTQKIARIKEDVNINELPYEYKSNGYTYRCNMENVDLFDSLYIDVCIEHPEYSSENAFGKYVEIVEI